MTKKLQLPKFLQRVSLVEKIMFTRNLAEMSGAGLSLPRALKTLARQSKSQFFQETIIQIADDVRKGQSLASSFSKQPKIFNEFFVNMIKVGELSGNLEQVLKILSSQMKKDHDLIAKVRGAMFYPAVILVAMLGIGTGMMIFVVPKLTTVFEELNVDLPLTTRVLISFSHLLQNYILFALIGLVILIVLFRFFIKTKRGKKYLHLIFLHTPIFGTIVKKVNLARFSRTLSSLVKGGLGIVESLNVLSHTLGNLYYQASLKRAAKAVEQGETLHQTLSKDENLYPLMILQMVEVGEETGSLADILERLASFYEEEVDQTTKNLASIIEPILMIIIGAAVGFFAISMITPMYSMMGNL